jgi:hypothetical protein
MEQSNKPRKQAKSSRKKNKSNKITYHKFTNVNDVIKRNYRNMNEDDLRILLWVRHQVRFKLQKYLMEGANVKPRFR